MTAAPMLTITPVLQARADTDDLTAGAVMGLVAAIVGAVDLRRPPSPWRASYPMDDPEHYAPDLWVAELPAGTVWCKSDGGHDPLQPDAAGVCSWCGAAHADPRPLYTFMDPSDY